MDKDEQIYDYYVLKYCTHRTLLFFRYEIYFHRHPKNVKYWEKHWN